MNAAVHTSANVHRRRDDAAKICAIFFTTPNGSVPCRTAIRRTRPYPV